VVNIRRWKSHVLYTVQKQRARYKHVIRIRLGHKQLNIINYTWNAFLGFSVCYIFNHLFSLYHRRLGCCQKRRRYPSTKDCGTIVELLDHLSVFVSILQQCTTLSRGFALLCLNRCQPTFHPYRLAAPHSVALVIYIELSIHVIYRLYIEPLYRSIESVYTNIYTQHTYYTGERPRNPFHPTGEYVPRILFLPFLCFIYFKLTSSLNFSTISYCLEMYKIKTQKYYMYVLYRRILYRYCFPAASYLNNTIRT
jgi:hypothetical protein